MNDVSGNFEPNIDLGEDYIEHIRDEEIQTSVLTDNSTDYTNHFENLEIIGILICCIIFGSCLAISFIKGFNK